MADTPPAQQQAEPNWLAERERAVQAALSSSDHAELARLAARPGGFGGGAMRQKAWAELLRVNDLLPSWTAAGGDADAEGDRAPHKDETQVGLDTARSFVTYPVGLPTGRKAALQADLHDLIVSVLRRYPRLSYFQGYHDILSVLYLTFIPPLPAAEAVEEERARARSKSEDRSRSRSASRARRRGQGRAGGVGVEGLTLSPVQTPATSSISSGSAEEKIDTAEKDVNASDDASTEAPDPEDPNTDSPPSLPTPPTPAFRNTPQWLLLRRCAAVISLCRVRDAMGSGMEPMMGMLRMLKRILRAADPDLAALSARISPVPTLPFFALSWILCLFSHDVDTLEPVQRMFDFLLGRNPVSALYLAVAILITKKPQMLRLAQALGPEAADDPSLLHPLFARLPPLYADTPDHPLPPRSSHVRDVTVDKGASSPARDPNPYDPIPLSRCFALADELMRRYPWDGDVVRGREVMGAGSVLMTYAAEEAGLCSRAGPEEVDNGEARVRRRDVVEAGDGNGDRDEVEEDMETGTDTDTDTDTDADGGAGGWLRAMERRVDVDVVRPNVPESEDEAEAAASAEAEERLEEKRRRRALSSARKQTRAVRRLRLGVGLALGVVLLGVGVAVWRGRAGGGHVDALELLRGFWRGDEKSGWGRGRGWDAWWAHVWRRSEGGVMGLIEMRLREAGRRAGAWVALREL